MGPKEKRDLFSMLDGEFAEGHEILDLMQGAIEHPDIMLTEREKCRIFLGRLFFAAATEGLNRAQEKFPVGQVELVIDLFVMCGEALASITVQSFDQSSPRARRVVRAAVKEQVMVGYDHFMKALDKAGDAEGSPP